MSDSEEDYMSDKLLMGCEKDDVRPGLLFNKTQKRYHEIYKKQEENKAKKPKSYKEQEAETRHIGLNTAITPDNKGFKLLEKMGYKQGTGLGKTYSGMTEPVEIKLKTSTSGVGRENHVNNMVKVKKSLKENGLQNKVKEFKLTKAAQISMVKLQKDYFKAQRVCENLDFEHGVQSPDKEFFWSKKTKDALKKKNEEEKETEDFDEQEEDEEISENTLNEIIIYLRKNYKYCMYCGDYVRDEDEFCPGYFRTDHDE